MIGPSPRDRAFLMPVSDCSGGPGSVQGGIMNASGRIGVADELQVGNSPLEFVIQTVLSLAPKGHDDRVRLEHPLGSRVRVPYPDALATTSVATVVVSTRTPCLKSRA